MIRMHFWLLLVVTVDDRRYSSRYKKWLIYKENIYEDGRGPAFLYVRIEDTHSLRIAGSKFKQLMKEKIMKPIPGKKYPI